MTVEQAQASLTGTGLKPRTVERFDESVPFGRVIGTEPSNRTQVYRGDKGPGGRVQGFAIHPGAQRRRHDD